MEDHGIHNPAGSQLLAISTSLRNPHSTLPLFGARPNLEGKR